MIWMMVVKGKEKVSLSPDAKILLEIGNVQFISIFGVLSCSCILVTDEVTSQGGTCHPEKPIWMET